MYIHAVIIDNGGDVSKTLDSVADCENIDILTRKINQKDLDKAITMNCYYNVLMPDNEVEKELNRLIMMTNCEYTLILESGQTVKNITSLVEEHKKKNKHLSMVRSYGHLEKVLINTYVFRWLCGFSESQTIMEKIEIQAKNEDHEDYIINWEDLYDSN